MILSRVLSAVLWCASILLLGTAGLVYIVLSVVFSPKQLQPCAKLVARCVLCTAGQRLVTRGTIPSLDDGPYIYMFNHTSMLDSLVTIAVLPEFTGAIGKEEQFAIPIWGGILRRWGVVPINRTALGDAIRSLESVEKTLNLGMSLLIAPEGTRSESGVLGPFKKGPFHVALNTGVTIVPMALMGVHRAKHRGSWLLHPGRVEARFGTPILIGEDSDMDSLRSKTREAIEALMQAECA